MRALAVAPLLAIAAPAGAQALDEGGFVTRLGRDTIAVERYARYPDRIEGERVLRVPATTMIRYVARVRGGRITVLEASHFTGDRLDSARTTSVTTLHRDGVVSVLIRERGTDTVRVETRLRAIPMLMYTYALVEQLIRQDGGAPRGRGGDSIPVAMVYPGQREVIETWIRPGRDSTAVATFHGQPGFGLLDAGGRLLSFQALGTVLKVEVERTAGGDVEGLAREYAARDAAGRPLGALSPRDTLRAVAGQARVLIDYGRPSRRGRTIFGNVVPWGRVWRTGADAATQLTLTRDVTLGGQRLAAGRYTLWTLPEPGSATLIINAQTGQWGTEYDPRRDLLRVPMTVRRLEASEERLTISVEEGALRIRWDTEEWSVAVNDP